MFTVTQRVYLIHIDEISLISVVDSVENRRNAFLLVAVLQVISTPQNLKKLSKAQILYITYIKS